MTQFRFQGYAERIADSCVRLEPIFPGSVGGTGISAVVIETVETTPEASFWGTTATCGRFEVIVRKVG